VIKLTFCVTTTWLQCYTINSGGRPLASFDIGAKLRQERSGRGISIEDISRDTRIPLRYLEAIETGNFAILPGLLFTRNFVKQYALALNLDPDPLVAELPKPDESTAQLPQPPTRDRSSYGNQNIRSIISSVVWLLLAAGASLAAYMHFNRSTDTPLPGIDSNATLSSHPVIDGTTPPAASPEVAPIFIQQAIPGVNQAPAGIETGPANTAMPSPPRVPAAVPPAAAGPVTVILTAHADAWVEVSADGKPAFTATLISNETRNVSAAEQVKIVTGNAGALGISLNGKTVDMTGPLGHARAIKLTAEGPQLLLAAPPPVFDDRL
jgi:cytoskeleton protein RodZ